MAEKGPRQPVEQDPISPDLEQDRKKQRSDLDNTTTSTVENGPSGTETAVDGEPEVPEQVYITGVKLTAVMASVTLVGFLILLDMSIIATVSTINI
jgi:hypothetical protein